ncbi:butyrophilin subfamily 1 member A1-like [Carettochelys insculpta]|uniref:butyrophilin subfamily 1 member A1-like n=1 Tax=Carettochelys insculpta TaxID=44489 RepID=UPI003EBF7387
MAIQWWLCVCSLGILLLAPCSLAETFSLSGSPDPVVGIVGQDVVLPCQLSPPAGLPSMDVQWRKTDPEFIVVHEYMNEGAQNLPGDGYQTRTELFPQEFHSGNVSLKLKQLRVVDDGQYRCFARNLEWSLEAATELRVSAVAPVFIDVLGPREQGIGLTCRSSGWFPEPQLQWVGKNGQNLKMKSVTNRAQDREKLYSVVSHITVTEDDNRDISCVVRNALLQTERQSAIHLSSDVFPHASRWLAAFWVLFTLVLVAAGACAYLGYTAKRKASEKKRAKEEAQRLLENEKKVLETASQDLRDSRDKAFEQLAFRRARSYMVRVTLDRNCKHREITVCVVGRRVWHDPPSMGRDPPTDFLIAVGREGFVARRDPGGEGGVCRWYWEVEVGHSPDWELGVVSETVRDKLKYNRLTRPLEQGCWALGRSEGQYHPREADTVIQSWAVKPTVIGLYLDLEARNLLFYSVGSMALILEIPVGNSERLFPFLCPGRAAEGAQGEPLSICPPSDWDFPQKLMKSGTVSVGQKTTIQGDKEAKGNSTAPPGYIYT